jgi:hypothetical protein
MKIHKGDTIQIIAGKDAGKKGRVELVNFGKAGSLTLAIGYPPTRDHNISSIVGTSIEADVLAIRLHFVTSIASINLYLPGPRREHLTRVKLFGHLAAGTSVVSGVG